MYKTSSFYASVYASVDESAFDAADGDAPDSYPLSSAASVNAPTHKKEER